MECLAVPLHTTLLVTCEHVRIWLWLQLAQLPQLFAENILQLGWGEINEAVDIADMPLFGPPRAPAMSDRKPVEKFSKKIEKLWICFYMPGGAGGSTRVLFL